MSNVYIPWPECFDFPKRVCVFFLPKLFFSYNVKSWAITLLTILICRFLYLYILPSSSVFATVFKVLHFSAAQIEILFFKAPLSRSCRGSQTIRPKQRGTLPPSGKRPRAVFLPAVHFFCSSARRAISTAPLAASFWGETQRSPGSAVCSAARTACRTGCLLYTSRCV